MATTSKPKPPAPGKGPIKGGRPPARPGDRVVEAPRASRWPWFAGAAVVVVALLLAVGLSQGGGEGAATEAGTSPTRPVDVFGAALASLPDGATATDPAIGQPAPELRGRTFDGTPISIGRSGNPTVVLFVAHWCPHCQREVPLLAKGLKLPAGVDLLTVSTGVAEDRGNFPPKTWLDKQGWRYPTLADSADSAAAKAYGLAGYPYYVVLDRTGKVVTRGSGEKTVAEVTALAERAKAA